jgi:hypothetical protein
MRSTNMLFEFEDASARGRRIGEGVTHDGAGIVPAFAFGNLATFAEGTTVDADAEGPCLAGALAPHHASFAKAPFKLRQP